MASLRRQGCGGGRFPDEHKMDVFSLRDEVVDEYRRFATSFTNVRAADLRQQLEAIYESGRYWPEPLVQINPCYRLETSVRRLVDDGVLESGCAEIFRDPAAPAGESLGLYKHQQQAISLAHQGESFVVTTGTGSGKSLCFFIPIVNAVLAGRRRGEPARTRAIIVYPMNALANSQNEELDKFLKNAPSPAPVTFERYTGQENRDQRQAIAANPPDILLTNFMMLELLMTRQDDVDRRVIGNCDGLEFLVLDELHTYRGRQGADVALLVRRVRERLSPGKLLCIGTSATMASEGSAGHKASVVARVASKLFAADIPESNVVFETLDRVTDPAASAESVRSKLGVAIDTGIPKTIDNRTLRGHPLAIWIETRMGLAWSEENPQWTRARPMTLTEAVRALAKESGRSPEACREALRDLLLVSSLPERVRTGRPTDSNRGFFAFKLHQFLSGAGHAYATLEAAGYRTVTVDEQQFLPGDPAKRLYAVHFCLECGHEYHPVRLVDEDGRRQVLARRVDDAPPPRPEDEKGGAGSPDDDFERQFGFLTLRPCDDEFDFEDRDEDYPEAWLEQDKQGNPRLKRHYARTRAQELAVEPDGTIGRGLRAWFLPGGFRFCLRCRTTQSSSAKDRNRLASLTAEGRSSATTLLVASVLRWMHGAPCSLRADKRKLLGFTDNRQDAALQAGHFNDFVFVSLVRAGFLAALEDAGPAGLRSHQLGAAHQKALGFDRTESEMRCVWLLEPGLRGFNLQEAESTLRQVLAYRVWFDQRKGWRITNPNLEQLDTIAVEYLGLEDLCKDDSLFAASPEPLRSSPATVRADVYRVLLDYLRKGLAIKSQVLDANELEQTKARSHSRLRVPWGFDGDERPRPARWLMVESPPVKGRDEDLLVRGGARSALGKALRSTKLWSGTAAARSLKNRDLDALIEALLASALEHGLVSDGVTPFDNKRGWRLNDSCVLFRLKPEAEVRGANAFFRDFYHTLARLMRDPRHPLFGFEAREHTAQVEGEKREVREKRFRYGEKEREELASDEQRLRDLGESGRFLPVLFCSPTMELGVDISALNAVYLRNVPPTPANYAQRSGRAGRGGDAALALTYCSAQSPHDQYFFRDPRAMVHGEVRPPLLDLANRDLVDSHLQAVWLAATGRELAASISELLVLEESNRPLNPDIAAAVGAPGASAEATRRIRRVLELLEDELTPGAAPWYPGREGYSEAVVATAPGRFDSAFGRWRDLFAAAEEQRDAARRTMDNYSAPAAEIRAARMRHAQALDQLNLLKQGTSSQSSDFYTYRYLATEGFLPGYNFPRLPLMAFVPAGADGRGRETFLQRPRFLAIAEFGPGSLVYHEGRAFRVERAMLSLGSGERRSTDAMLPTLSVRICKGCGGGHFSEGASMCHACGRELSDADPIPYVFRVENVATRPVERITANDEERRRQGFELQTTFEWATRDHVLDVRSVDASDGQGPILRMAYGTGATIVRLNKGLRRRARKKVLGFLIDPVSGYWAKGEDDDAEPTDPSIAARQRIVPAVQDRKNALLVQPFEEKLTERTQATVQHALLRGIESVFQLEEGELLAEPMPSRDARNGFLLYEATEGGAGVLTRLVGEPDTIPLLAREALRILHFDTTGMPADAGQLADVADARCVAACYRCLMSYFNQPDHDLLDRRDSKARELLVRLTRASVRTATVPPAAEGIPSSRPWGWLQRAASFGIPAPDSQPWSDGEARLELVWRAHYVAAALDGCPATLLARLRDHGFEVIVFPASEDGWPACLERLKAALGR